MIVFLRFWRSLTKNDSVRVLDMIYKFFSTLTQVLGRFSRIRIFPDRTWIFGHSLSFIHSLKKGPSWPRWTS